MRDEQLRPHLSLHAREEMKRRDYERYRQSQLEKELQDAAKHTAYWLQEQVNLRIRIAELQVRIAQQRSHRVSQGAESSDEHPSTP